MKYALPSLVLGLLLPGCIGAFDESWFSPDRIEEYTLPHNVVPEEYLEFVMLEGTQVDDEEEAPTLAGAWLHQCLEGGDCANPNAPEFDPARQDKTVLYFHGNSDNLDHYWDRMQMFWNMGYRVFAIDYRGYGMSSGEPSEAGIYADARTARDHAAARLVEENPSLALPNGAPTPSILLDLAYYGYSLGSTATIDLAVADPPKVLVTEGALAGAQAFMDDALGLGFHSSVLMGARFDNAGKIPFVISPKLITHGLLDDFVAFEFATVLYDAAEEPKQLYPVEGADHGNVPCPDRDPALGGEDSPCLPTDEWLERVGGFLEEHMP